MFTVMLVVAIVLLVLLAPFFGLGLFFETSTGQSVYDGINWVLGGGWAVIIFGGLIWLGCMCALVYTPFSLMEGQSIERKHDSSNVSLFFSFIINVVLTILVTLLARWVWPFGWSRKVTMWVMIISIVLQGVITLLNMAGNKASTNDVPKTLGASSTGTGTETTIQQPETPKFRAD